MTNRITMQNLRDLCGLLNRLTGNPQEPYTSILDENGKQSGLVHNPGCFYIAGRGGLVQLVQMGAGGGETCPIGNTYHLKRDLHKLIHAFLDGYELASRDIENRLDKALENQLLRRDGK
jgi:hypothetical protein